jgi:hypothetical protein
MTASKSFSESNIPASIWFCAIDYQGGKLLGIDWPQDATDTLEAASKRIATVLITMPKALRPRGFELEMVELSNQSDNSRVIVWCGDGLPGGAQFAYRC